MKKMVMILILGMMGSWLGAQTGAYGNPGADERILIAFEKTRFKTALVNEMLNLLKDREAFILVVDHKRKGLDGLKASDYDAVFISNSGATAKVRPHVIRWLADNGGNPENVIVHTTQTTVWTPKVETDSITSASLRKTDDIDRKAAEYVELILQKLN